MSAIDDIMGDAKRTHDKFMGALISKDAEIQRLKMVEYCAFAVFECDDRSQRAILMDKLGQALSVREISE